MKLLNLKGYPVNINVNKYKINWSGKSPSKPQFQVKQFLSKYWQKHIVVEELRIPASLFRVDLLNFTLKIAVETNGRQHEEFNPFFHKNKVNYLNSLKRDDQKRKWLEINDIQLIEINENEIKDLSRKFFIEKFAIYL